MGRIATNLTAKPLEHYTAWKQERSPILNLGQGKNRYADHKSMRVTHIHTAPGNEWLTQFDNGKRENDLLHERQEE